ncbi:MAG: undecaprenyl/decaprenyl-phosphate alpha-N-acetylglucosaminyl 1-phosphate transferase [Bacteriovoracaceae bacterium]|nr:undecaprenyl/decaprenyl-phosphate alpha-N-acetylglucosaminyl 1-phosphate transferase [Bacteriovoracaceae bacterium]
MHSLATILFIVSICVVTFTFIVALIITPFINKLAIKVGLLDRPGERKIHQTVIPMSGGSIIFLSCILTIGISTILVHFGICSFLPGDSIEHILDSIEPIRKLPQYILLGVSLFLLWIVGIVDDFYKSEGMAKYKLVVQFLAACIAVFFANTHITFFKPVILSQILSVVWIVGIVNAFNLLDNMDGLSGGISVICSLVLMGLGIWQGEIIVVIMSSVFIGAAMAFLINNFPKAKIFLGDNGSMTVGFVLAVLTLKISYLTSADSLSFPVLIPLIILAIPLTDVFSVIVIRVLNKRPIYIGDNNHVSHRLTRVGFSKRDAVLIIYMLTLSTSLSGFLLLKTDIWFSLIIIFQILVLIFLFILLLTKGDKTSIKVKLRNIIN